MQFSGFSPESLTFFHDLEAHNQKAWFEKNRSVYDKHILTPLRKLVMDLSSGMHRIDPYLELRPVVNKTISRIYRDTRFSNDKRIFRTNMWIGFKRQVSNWHDIPTWWFEIKPDGYTYGMGFYDASPNTMRLFREQIETREHAFRKIIAFFPGDPPFSLEGRLYKRLALSKVADDIRTWYERRNLYLICRCEPDNILFSEALVPHLEERFKELAPLYHFLMNLN
ncbi:MAG: DUF2461 domain-containing protein [FCB group bacterium]|nr:DUF2461 domain-containing protein [FCB group bacterium]